MKTIIVCNFFISVFTEASKNKDTSLRFNVGDVYKARSITRRDVKHFISFMKVIKRGRRLYYVFTLMDSLKPGLSEAVYYYAEFTQTFSCKLKTSLFHKMAQHL